MCLCLVWISPPLLVLRCSAVPVLFELCVKLWFTTGADMMGESHFPVWINNISLKRLSPLFSPQAQRHISDLYEDLRDGHNLISLLEVLSGETLVSFGDLWPSDLRTSASAVTPCPVQTCLIVPAPLSHWLNLLSYLFDCPVYSLYLELLWMFTWVKLLFRWVSCLHSCMCWLWFFRDFWTFQNMLRLCALFYVTYLTTGFLGTHLLVMEP